MPKSLKKMILERDIRRALDRNEFVVHYQPFVNVITGQITGMEALVRWQHQQRGLILPEEFLSLAEDIRLIVSIDEWVLRNGMHTKQGLAGCRISARVYSSKSFCAHVSSTEYYGYYYLDPKRNNVGSTVFGAGNYRRDCYARYRNHH